MKHKSLIYALKHFGAAVEQIQDPAEVAPTWRGLLGHREIHWVQVGRYVEKVTVRFGRGPGAQTTHDHTALHLVMSMFVSHKCLETQEGYRLYFHVERGLKLSAHVYSAQSLRAFLGSLNDTDGLMLANLRGECPDCILADWIMERVPGR